MLLLCTLVLSLQAAAPRIHHNIIYGTAWKKERTAEYVLAALKEGFRAIDTANYPKHYSEALVGDALKRSPDIPREELFIQTKFTPDACTGQPEAVHPYDVKAPYAEQVRQSFEGSLKHLGVSYMDSYILHAPYAEHKDTMAAWREMEKLHAEGLAKHLGVSNVNADQLRDLLDEAAVKPTFVQNRCQAKKLYDAPVQEVCRQHGLRYQGFWLLTGNSHLKGAAPALAIAAKHGRTVEQVMYAYFQQGLGMLPLSGPKQVSHMALALASSSLLLSKPELAALKAVQLPAFDHTDPVTVVFANKLARAVDMFWVNGANGERVAQGALGPGEDRTVRTFHGHTFLAAEQAPAPLAPLAADAAEAGSARGAGADGGGGGGAGAVLLQSWSADRGHGESQRCTVDGRLGATFRNDAGEDLVVYWVDPASGKQTAQGTVKAGREMDRSTFTGHVFEVRTAAAKELLLLWVATVDLGAETVGREAAGVTQKYQVVRVTKRAKHAADERSVEL
jgi:diketogulonate reductase-like aldo/keto reductase